MQRHRCYEYRPILREVRATDNVGQFGSQHPCCRTELLVLKKIQKPTQRAVIACEENGEIKSWQRPPANATQRRNFRDGELQSLSADGAGVDVGRRKRI